MCMIMLIWKIRYAGIVFLLKSMRVKLASFGNPIRFIISTSLSLTPKRKLGTYASLLGRVPGLPPILDSVIFVNLSMSAAK